MQSRYCKWWIFCSTSGESKNNNLLPSFIMISSSQNRTFDFLVSESVCRTCQIRSAEAQFFLPTDLSRRRRNVLSRAENRDFINFFPFVFSLQSVWKEFFVLTSPSIEAICYLKVHAHLGRTQILYPLSLSVQTWLVIVSSAFTPVTDACSNKKDHAMNEKAKYGWLSISTSYS
jgi:hypothetical protein